MDIYRLYGKGLVRTATLQYRRGRPCTSIAKGTLWPFSIPTLKFQRLSATLVAASTTPSALLGAAMAMPMPGGEAGQIYRIDLARREFEEFAPS